MSSALLGYSQSVTAFRFEHGRRTCYYGSEKYDTEGDMFYLVLDSDSGEILDIYNQKRYKYDARVSTSRKEKNVHSHILPPVVVCRHNAERNNGTK